MAQHERLESGHSTFSHDSLDALGYDWSRVADPTVAPRHPFKVYLPLTSEEVAQAVREARALGQHLAFRGQGHSSNDLVLQDRGQVLSFQRMDRIGRPDPAELSVTVQAGASLVEVDRQLSAHGLGLPVMGDHRHLTAGGFASVGGVSPASHRHGLFVDNVRALEYVTSAGDIRRCSRTDDSGQLLALLTGRGQHGAITELTLDVIREDKSSHLLENDRRVVRDVDTFLTHALDRMADPEAARLQRGYWIDLDTPTGGRRFGQWSDYRETSPTPARWRHRNLTQQARQVLGRALSHAPAPLERPAKIAGVSAVVFTPRYLTVRDAEVAADSVLDYSLGDPIRWFVAWAPLDRYASTFEALYRLFYDYRKRTGCFTFVGVLAQAIRSAYLSRGEDTAYGAVMMICGLRPERLSQELLTDLVGEMDDICIEAGALRYLHSITSKDPKREALLDPNTPYRTTVTG